MAKKEDDLEMRLEELAKSQVYIRIEKISSSRKAQ